MSLHFAIQSVVMVYVVSWIIVWRALKAPPLDGGIREKDEAEPHVLVAAFVLAPLVAAAYVCLYGFFKFGKFLQRMVEDEDEGEQISDE